MNTVFVDSTGFFAYFVKRDAAHEHAQVLFEQSRQENWRLYTTDHVIAETLTLLRVRGHNHFCHAFYNSLQHSVALKVGHTTLEEFSRTADFFLKHSDKGYSFTDCLSFVVMREKKLTDALTTDAHFAQAGFKALLAAA